MTNQSESSDPSNNPVLLIVDDNAADRALLVQYLQDSFKEEHYDVVEKSSAKEALAFIETVTPVCCLVDFQMPVENGLDFLQTLRRTETINSIPVVIMTGEGDEKTAVEIMRNGAQDYLIKNDITPSILARSISSAIYTSELQNKLQYLAHHDHLTGLINRSLFMDRLKTTIDHCDRYNQSCSLVYIDVDNFKQINDQYGHAVGDILLKATSERIRSSCRVTDSAARLGGDEFVVLLSHVDQQSAFIATEKILKKISEPVYLESQCIFVSLSIGIAHYPDTARDMHDLMRQADEAMYQAKRGGKSRYFQFTQKQKEQWDRRRTLEQMLPFAIANNELELAYQPIVKISDLSIRSLEVLIRWNPEGYEITATEIIEMVELLGCFEDFHCWLINAALQQLHQWQKMVPDMLIALNIPASQTHSNHIAELLARGLDHYGLKPEQIELEITETTLMKHPELSSDMLRAIQQQGVGIAVDDFGAGYSSMSYLTSLPLNTLKIDQQFLLSLDSDHRNLKVIEAITALGHSLGLGVVAEGVETEAQLMAAESVGCDFVQGYYLGKPQQAKADWNEFIKLFNLSV